MEKINEIKKLVNESGNNFHYKVVNFLRENEWTVDVSPYYNDNFTDKPREIDIVAEKEYPITVYKGPFPEDGLYIINVRLYIECKYITNDIAFWFDNINKNKAIELVLKSTPLKDPDKYSMTQEHRYLLEENVAKLYTCKEGDPIYKALSQSLNAMIYYRSSKSIIPAVLQKASRKKIVLNYPVIVCNDFSKIYKCNTLSTNDPEIIKNNFLLETNYAFLNKDGNNQNEYLLIDIVDFSNIQEFITKLEKTDLVAISKIINWESRDYNNL